MQLWGDNSQKKKISDFLPWNLNGKTVVSNFVF